jgi:hypothetical protein
MARSESRQFRVRCWWASFRTCSWHRDRLPHVSTVLLLHHCHAQSSWPSKVECSRNYHAIRCLPRRLEVRTSPQETGSVRQNAERSNRCHRWHLHQRQRQGVRCIEVHFRHSQHNEAACDHIRRPQAAVFSWVVFRPSNQATEASS